MLENIKILFTTFLIFGILVVSLYFAPAYPIAKFALGVINTILIFWAIVLVIGAAFLCSNSARSDISSKIVKDAAFRADTTTKVRNILSKTTYIYVWNFCIVLCYIAACAYATANSFFFTASLMLVLSIVTFIFPRAVVSFAEYCNDVIIRYDERASWR